MENENQSFFKSTTGIIIIVLLVLCCCCLVVFTGLLGGAFYYNTQSASTVPEIATPASTDIIPPTSTPSPTLVIEVTRVPVAQVPTETILTLDANIVPSSDPYDLACRLLGKCNIPTSVPSGPFKNGDQQSFWLTNTDNAQSFKIKATLQYSTEHAYFWVEDGVKYDQAEAQQLVDTFETKIYPTDREFFGSEWSPGVDNDPHIYIVYGRGIGATTAGYFAPQNEYNPLVQKYSNAHELYAMNADNSALGDTYTYGVLAHEFQHMIHWKQDRNETSWMNEGFSEVAVLLNGYYTSGAARQFAADPDLQLTDWNPGSPGSNGPHYGASFLFLSYFLDRFGQDDTKALVRDQQNGMESVDDILKSANAIDKVSGKPITADDVFMDWAATNYLLDGSIGDGRYVYHNYAKAPKVEDTESISNCPSSITRTVNQYGTDYINYTCGGLHTLHFEGATQTGLLPVDAFSGKYAFWSNKGDESDMTLTREFDFTKASGPLTLQYQTWYDVEKDYDYVFLEASQDAGKTWQILKTPSGTDKNPSGNSYGWGYNAKSTGWVQENVDLSQFKGQKVQIRFEYVTDAAVNGEGFLLDDVSIPEINYSSDFEKDDGGWQGQGFVRVENILPQTFRLALINKSGQITVQDVIVAPDQTADINVDLTDATLLVSGTTRFTREDGHYTVTVK